MLDPLGKSAAPSQASSRTPPNPDSDAESTAGGCKQHALRQQLPGNAPPPSPEAEANGHLLHPNVRAHQHEVGQVDAADQQNQPYRALQQVKRRADVPHQFILKPRHLGVKPRAYQQGLQLGETVHVGPVQPINPLLCLA